MEERPIPDFSKGKLISSPFYFIIHFKGLFGVKINWKFRIEMLFTLRAWRREKRRRKKGRKDQEFIKNARIFKWNSSGVINNKVCE